MKTPVNTPPNDGWTRYKVAQPTKRDCWVITAHTYRTKPTAVKIHKQSNHLNEQFCCQDTYEFGHIYWQYFTPPEY